MAFNPDQYLSEKQGVQDAPEFDPGRYLVEKKNSVENVVKSEINEADKPSFGEVATLGVKNAIDKATLGNYPDLAARFKSLFSDESVQSLKDKEISQMNEVGKYVTGYDMRGPDKSSYADKFETFGKNTVDALTAQHYPQIAAGIKSIGSDRPYVELRDNEIERLAQLSKENPKSAMGGTVAGIGAQLAIPMGAAAKGAGLVSKIARGSITGGLIGGAQNPGDKRGIVDPLQIDERLQNSKTGAILGGSIPIVAAGIEKAANSKFGQATLQRISDSSAVKQAGAMLKDYRQILDKDRLRSLGDTLKNETVQVPSQSGPKAKRLLEAGDSFGDVAQKAELLEKQTGDKIGQIYRQIDHSISDPSQLPASVLRKMQETSKFNPRTDVAEIQQMIREKYGLGLDGDKVVKQVDEVLSTFQKRGSSLQDALKLKNDIDAKIKYSRKIQDLPEFQQALFDIRNYIRDKTNAFAEAIADDIGFAGAKELPKLNKVFGNASQIADIANDRVARESANRMFGLTDYLAGGILGGAASATQGNVSPESVALGAVGALANRGARKYGPGMLSKVTQIAATGAGKLAPFGEQVLAPMSQMVSNNAGILGGAQSAQSMNDRMSKYNQGPIYRRLERLGNKGGQ